MIRSVSHYLRMIRFSHTLFALPFALAAVAIVATRYRSEISVDWKKTALIVIAFTAMRSLAMAINRIADRHIDARNPRTQSREIPAGILSTRAVAAFAALSAGLLVVTAWMLTPVAGLLALPAAAIVGGYSFAKRFTWLCHFWLGTAIGMAPLGVYLALLERVHAEAFLIFAALAFYIAGFDILYALQDLAFDQGEKLHSIPVRFGVRGAMWISRAAHSAALVMVALLIVMLSLSPVSWLLFAVLAGLLTAEHTLVGSAENPRYEKIPIAFFHLNSAFSIVFLLTVLFGLKTDLLPT